MHARYYRDMIVRAVLGTDPAMVAVVADPDALDLISAIMEDSERSKQILRAKGYGVAGTSASSTAAMVPDAAPAHA